MSHIQDRWFTEVPDPEHPGKTIKVKSQLYGKVQRYKVRWHGPDGRERSKSFPDKQKAAAESFRTQLDMEMLTGRYVDPNAGKRLFVPLAWKWLKTTSNDPASRAIYTARIKRGIVPFFDGYTISNACTVETMHDYVKWLDEQGWELSTQVAIFEHVVAIMDMAVANRSIPENPCRNNQVRKPKATRRKIVPWTPQQVQAIWQALPERNKIVVPLGTGAGLRAGEIFGFSPDDIRRGDGVLDVRRQIRYVDRTCVFSLPKGGKTRVVPLAEELLADLDGYMEMYEPVEVTLPWRVPNGKPETVPLLMVRADLRPWHGALFRAGPWAGAFPRAGLTQRRRVDGMHAFRHFYASSSLADGVSILELAEYLGHHNPAITLKYYAHLMPSSHARSRQAVNALLGNLRA
ncbi:tyrosine-type recombinase/integrase [Nocardia wallacei]|uniref:tyrosine-type recombinase/integrase n=1 Tax=Nocardia wallacei TaxID=480035 RepID=UPI0024588CBD|nr:site-specific integrase [Nocardia wallacei]